MDWSRAKTIFIVTFLCLNVFLGFQLIEKRNESNINVQAQVTLQERLEENNIRLAIEEPEQTKMGYHITGKPRDFDEEELQNNINNQDVSVRLDNHILFSSLEEPYPLRPANLSASVDAFLSDNMMFGDEYVFGEYVEEDGEILVYQTYNDQPLNYLESEYAHARLLVNEDMEIESYSQRYLEVTAHTDREQELITPIKAIELLINENQIGTDVVIDDVEIGYYNIHQADIDAPEFFAPMWRIDVNGKDRFVNALDWSIP
ncbi:two-component system regulatory protein YycI [Alteribacter populi]|uniref:two-component system regulatory protein YycI n=1 Tax=Alteribacter populi TaxID=2011011 RepID=UPI000BBAD590|nr:two-component system regulatory protein YycI [Alteribacter populi]